MVPLNHTLGNAQLDTNLVNRRKMYIDNIKLQKMKKNWESNTRGENIQSGHRDGIWHRKIFHTSNKIGK